MVLSPAWRGYIPTTYDDFLAAPSDKSFVSRSYLLFVLPSLKCAFLATLPSNVTIHHLSKLPQTVIKPRSGWQRYWSANGLMPPDSGVEWQTDYGT